MKQFFFLGSGLALNLLAIWLHLRRDRGLTDESYFLGKRKFQKLFDSEKGRDHGSKPDSERRSS